jgi:hypothetical protein
MSSPPFNWSEYFKLAEELGKRPDEASLRSALSRTYYYVFHLALKRAQDNDFKPLPGEGTHTQLWRVFSKSRNRIAGSWQMLRTSLLVWDGYLPATPTQKVSAGDYHRARAPAGKARLERPPVVPASFGVA